MKARKEEIASSVNYVQIKFKKNNKCQKNQFRIGWMVEFEQQAT